MDIDWKALMIYVRRQLSWAEWASEEDLKGTVSVGKLAHFTVLSADIVKIPEPEILKTKNVVTIIGGRVVYDAAAH